MRSTALRFILEESSKSLDIFVAVPRGRSPERFSLGLYRGKKCDDFQQRKTSLRAEKKAFLSHVLKDAHTHNHTHTRSLRQSSSLPLSEFPFRDENSNAVSRDAAVAILPSVIRLVFSQRVRFAL
jgi:hypothetical protein